MYPTQIDVSVERGQSELRLLTEVTAAAAQVLTAPARGRAATSYLRQRGIDASQLSSDWLLGYAPPGWTRLVDTLRGQFPDEALLNAGVGRRSSRGTLIDTFRDRVVFGIHQIDGTIAGFIGRDLSGHPTAPKYLNTHQHALFDKSNLLFGLYEGSRNAGPRQPVVVEGPLDVLAIAARQQADCSRDLLPVATCGTAVTRAHAVSMSHVTGQRETSVVVAMDADPAGRAATLAAGERLRGEGRDVRATLLPTGTDPADYLTRPDSTLDAFRADHVLPLINVHVEHAIADQGDRMQWVEGRLAALRSVSGYLASYPPTFAARQVSWIAESLNLEPSTVTSELADAFQAPHHEASRPRFQPAVCASPAADVAF